ncbi:SURF1 family protein [Georgenia faecalis]|uniref:SURF1 family cytochrome oxidase biogenesis protein n=1 Tax=Georgenia faecalis TaxID=2483799 RepID=UPI001F495A42|nr:SURF1 family protein [Georgenia faecalis]
MSRYRFVLSRNWLLGALAAVVLAATCVWLGTWQWGRHETRASSNHLVEVNYDAEPAPLDEVVDPTEPVPYDAVWRRVELTGHYAGSDVLLRNRPVDGRPAVRVLTPFVATTPDGGELAVVVDRGWITTATQDDVAVPEPPAGEVELVARLRQAEPPADREAPPGQVYAIAPEQVLEVAEVTGEDVLEGYVHAVEHRPAPTEALPQFPRPETTTGSHLSYAFQWWVFALGGLVGYLILVRREAGERAAQAGPSAHRERPRVRRRADEDEDALIEAQLAQRRAAADHPVDAS